MSYFLGVKSPGGRRYGTPKGWIVSLLIGAGLALTFYAFSAFGLMVSLDSLISDFDLEPQARLAGGLSRQKR